MKRKIINAGSWTIFVHGFIQLTRLLTSLVMTRLLAPEAFGVMAIAIVINSGLMLFSDIGLFQNVVRSKRGNDPRFLNTLWVMQIVRGFLIWVIALCSAAGLAALQSAGWVSEISTYGHPDLPYVIAAVGITAAIAGFESTKVAIARRELALAKLSRVEILGNIAAVGTTIVWGLIDQTIWALVAGWVTGAITRTLLTHLLLPGNTNRPEWDGAAFREVIDFGKWIMLSSILGFLLMSGDRIILGGLVSPDTLGLYAIAFSLISVLHQTSSRLMSGVVFPALSEVSRERPESLSRVYYKLKIPLDIVFLLASGLLFILAPLVVNVLFDSRYSGSGQILQILSITLVTSRFDISEQCYLALGKSRLLTLLNAIRLLALYTLVPTGYLIFGLHGAVWAMVVALGTAFPITIYLNYKHGIFDLKKELIVLPAFLAGIVLGEIVNAFAENVQLASLV